MLIHFHKQVTTAPKVRKAIQNSNDAGTVLADRFGVTPQTIYIYGCLFNCEFFADLFRRQVPGCKHLSGVTGRLCSKWEFRVVSLNKWSASRGHYKSQVPYTPEFAGRFISLIVLQSFLRA